MIKCISTPAYTYIKTLALEERQEGQELTYFTVGGKTGTYVLYCGWSGGAMVLGKLPVPGRPTIWMIVGQGPTVLAVGAGGGCLDIFTLLYLYFYSPLSPSLWETARYRLKYCLKGPLNPKLPTNQLTWLVGWLFWV